jgi:glycosyltransferase involved in cell wall biosynthesis
MRIAQVAPPFERVPPRAYGGTERVISTLTEELVRRGHEVTLFASGDSLTTAELEPIVERALWHHEPPFADLAPFWSLVLGKVWRRIDEFDVIHSHLDSFGFPLARAAARPVVTTLHGRLDRPELEPVYREFADAPLVSISRAQRAPMPWVNWVANVYHGIELDDYQPPPEPGRYLAFLGRVSPSKGLDAAIRVARRAGMPVKVAARLPLRAGYAPDAEEDWRYYQEVARPLLDGPGVQFVGEVGGRDKCDFLSAAAALLFPIAWPEPFGLVMPEALACGTPVIALSNGSVPEVIEDGLTGFVRDDEDGMVAAVARLHEIDRAACRAEAERRFSPSVMADGYERVYEELIGAQRSCVNAVA